VAYVVVVRNYGTQPITDLQVVENLVTTFGAGNTWSVGNITAPALTLNGAYDGRSVTNLLSGTDVLAAGASTTIRFVVTVQFVPGRIYFNQVLGSGRIGNVVVTDLSQYGSDPAPNGTPDTDNDPTGVKLGILAVPALSVWAYGVLLLGLCGLVWQRRRKVVAG
jgi:hypothetical protein